MEKINTAQQQETLFAGENVYASLDVIESPKGMEYTIKWFLDDSVIKTETKATVMKYYGD